MDGPHPDKLLPLRLPVPEATTHTHREPPHHHHRFHAVVVALPLLACCLYRPLPPLACVSRVLHCICGGGWASGVWLGEKIERGRGCTRRRKQTHTRRTSVTSKKARWVFLDKQRWFLFRGIIGVSAFLVVGDVCLWDQALGQALCVMCVCADPSAAGGGTHACAREGGGIDWRAGSGWRKGRRRERREGVEMQPCVRR